MSITSESSYTGLSTVCSGSIIHFLWILTAARCVIQSQVYQIRVDSVAHYTGGRVYVSHEAFVHPHFDPINNTNDAALIRFEPSTVPSTMLPVRLPFFLPNNFNLNHHAAIISGWGLTPINTISPVLHYGYGQVLNNSNQNCRIITGNRPNLLCARIFNQATSTCPGDIGSPLVIQVNRTTIQVGITVIPSNQKTCRNSLNLFTNVLDLRSWITNVTGVTF